MISSSRVLELSLSAVLASLLVATFRAPNARAASDTSANAATPAAAKLDTDNYLVEISANGPYKPGAVGEARVTLTAKGAYHINGQYPYRFKAAAPSDGVSYPKPVLERADGQFEEKTALFKLPFVVSRAGKFNIGGVFHMSVCSAGSCLMEKAPLELSVNVE